MPPVAEEASLIDRWELVIDRWEESLWTDIDLWLWRRAFAINLIACPAPTNADVFTAVRTVCPLLTIRCPIPRTCHLRTVYEGSNGNEASIDQWRCNPPRPCICCRDLSTSAPSVLITACKLNAAMSFQFRINESWLIAPVVPRICGNASRKPEHKYNIIHRKVWLNSYVLNDIRRPFKLALY